MTSKRKNTMIVIMAITAMLLVPATILAVAAYAEQQQQQQQNEDQQLQEIDNNHNNNRTNTVDSVGNTGTDDTNPEYNATKAEKDHVLTQEEIDMHISELLVKMDDLYFENTTACMRQLVTKTCWTNTRLTELYRTT